MVSLSTRPVVRPIPSRDASFARAVREAVLRHWRPACDDRALRAAVIDWLADRYPGVTIRPQEPLASLSPPGVEVWYVRRNGAAVSRSELRSRPDSDERNEGENQQELEDEAQSPDTAPTGRRRHPGQDDEGETGDRQRIEPQDLDQEHGHDETRDRDGYEPLPAP